MTNAQTDEPTREPFRLWPGVVIVTLQWLAWFVVPTVWPELTLYGVGGAVVGGLAVLVWWTLFSRAPWSERLGAILLMGVAVAATRPLLHESVAMAGMGVLFYIYAVPGLSLALVLWAVASRHLSLSDGARRAALVATILLACGVFTLVRSAGVTGEGDSQFAWRWTPTLEERLLARAGDTSTTGPPAPTAPVPAAAPALDTGAGWPGFRGPRRDGVVHGVRIDTEWTASPPVELWRRAIGPGWSSFAVRGGLVYTQEQRGDDELVAAYDVSTGEPVWQHRDTARFWESNGGPGPRGTPTLAGDRVYAFGATGILNALDAGDGGVVWSRNVASDLGAEVPYWGFASSPLVVDDLLVIVAAAGRLAAYDLATGDPRWTGPDGGQGYSSPHLLTIDGVAQVVLLSGAGATSVAPADGTPLWQHAWGAGIVQPALAADGDLLINEGDATGGLAIRRLAITHGTDGWGVEERWTSRGLKPYFNDFVVHEGHAYGFDGSILSCIDLGNGERAWKGGRYGHGQLLLLADQDVLLVVSEDGELALVSATPDGYTELARVPALDGKTWNHPALIGELLLVRNGQEMVAFRLRLAD